jgi:hypothetical protein
VASTTLTEHFATRANFGASKLELAVISILKNGPVMGLIPWVTSDYVYPYAIEDELPVVKPRLFDEANGTEQGTTIQAAEFLRIYGHDVLTDSSKLALMGKNAHSRQIQTISRSLRMTIENDFFNGSQASSGGRQMNGLRVKIPTTSSQSIANHATGAGLSCEKLDTLIAQVTGNNSEKVLIMDKKLKTRWGAFVRSSGSGLLLTGVDQLGRQADVYQGVPIIETEVNSQNVDILGFNETNNTSSVYCVRFGEGATSGLQGPSLDANGNVQTGLVVYDVGESFNTPTRLTRISWHIGSVVEDPTSIARLYNVTNAAITA